jgi:ABC-type dipeptide/oligopeptide/nickel transport system ATPase component
MSQLIGIVGASGTGKSSSMRNLNSKETFIVNILGKTLPFKGSKSMYNDDNKNIASISDWNVVTDILKGISSSRPEIKNIIIDDAGFIMLTEFFRRASEAGYNKFSEIGQHMFNVLNTAKSLREDLNVIVMFHEDVEIVDGFRPIRSIKTVGKMLSDKFDPQALPTVLLYTDVQDTKDGVRYQFVTNRTESIPAKSPMGMFDDLRIDNDLDFVIKKMQQYFDS